MKEIKKRSFTDSNEQKTAAKLGGLVCNKNAPSVKNAKLGGLVCNKNAPSVKNI